MTLTALAPLFAPPLMPADPELAADRNHLLNNAAFMAEFRQIEPPAAVLSTCHRLVLANDQLIRWLGAESEAALIGAVPGDLQPRPDGPDLVARTRFIESGGRGFLILTIQATPHPEHQARRPL